jgi:hypothetical protein
MLEPRHCQFGTDIPTASGLLRRSRAMLDREGSWRSAGWFAACTWLTLATDTLVQTMVDDTVDGIAPIFDPNAAPTHLRR